MDETSLSLLERLQRADNRAHWDGLYEVYAPLIRHWLAKYDVLDHDAEDLVQEVLMVMMKELPKFEHSGNVGAFRAWMKNILVHRLRNFWRQSKRHAMATTSAEQESQLALLEDPQSELSQLWHREHDRFVLKQLMAIVERQFSKKTWTAFYKVTLQDLPPQQVARELGISLNAVFISKSRVLNRLRQEAEGVVETVAGFSE